jgi:hypothetical protein
MDLNWSFKRRILGDCIFTNDTFCIIYDTNVINRVDKIVSMNILFVLKLEKKDIFIESVNVLFMVSDNSSCIANMYDELYLYLFAFFIFLNCKFLLVNCKEKQYKSFFYNSYNESISNYTNVGVYINGFIIIY